MVQRVRQRLSTGESPLVLRKQLHVSNEQGRGAVSLFRLERLRQDGRELGNGGLPFRDWAWERG